MKRDVALLGLTLLMCAHGWQFNSQEESENDSMPLNSAADSTIRFRNVVIDGNPERVAIRPNDIITVTYACVVLGTTEGLIVINGEKDNFDTNTGDFSLNTDHPACEDGKLTKVDIPVLP
ncbi:hypothetical protein H7097_01190 [Aeromicrobium sp.]|nr:hypothetical protein [Candidatus Saccharibacteria bacterium]